MPLVEWERASIASIAQFAKVDPANNDNIFWPFTFFAFHNESYLQVRETVSHARPFSPMALYLSGGSNDAPRPLCLTAQLLFCHKIQELAYIL